MMCQCAVEEAKIAKAGALGPSVRCDELGNYHHTQCTGSQCYCVHPHTGESQLGTEAHIADIAQLEDRCARQQLDETHRIAPSK